MYYTICLNLIQWVLGKVHNVLTKGGAPYIPTNKLGGFTAQLDKKRKPFLRPIIIN